MHCVLLHLAKKLLRLSLLKGVYFAISTSSKLHFYVVSGTKCAPIFFKKEVLKRNK
jgi:hypothetical protein